MNLVSIITPAYNAEKYIEETIKSVLNQTYDNWELIIVDDKSTDNTINIVEKYTNDNRIKLYKNDENSGVAKSRNNGILFASGDYIAFLDADDLWENDKLEKQIDFIKNNESYDVLCTSYTLINENSEFIKNYTITQGEISYEMLLRENLLGCSTVIIKKDAILKYMFTDKYMHEDLELWLKLSYAGHKIYGLPESLVKYRVISTSKSGNKFKSAYGRWKLTIGREDIGFLKSIQYMIYYMFGGLSKYYGKEKK